MQEEKKEEKIDLIDLEVATEEAKAKATLKVEKEEK